MAKVTYNTLVKDIRCRLDNVVFSKWKDTSYVRPYRKPSNPRSPEQMKVRNAFLRLVKNWSEGDRLLHDGWEAYARGSNMTGYNAFIGANALLQKNGEPIQLFKSMGEARLLSFQARKGTNPGEIVCSTVPPAEFEEKHLTIFSQETTEGIATGSMTRHDMGPMKNDEYLITGLETGRKYFLYAVITDREYLEAGSVSESVGVMTEAA